MLTLLQCYERQVDRGSDSLYWTTALKHREHLCNADSQWNKTTLGFRVIWENPAQSCMRKYRLHVPHAMTCITYRTLEFPRLISRVHQEVMILFVLSLAACPTGFYGEGCNQTCSCRNDGICHPASGQCVCTPGWTGANCTEGKWTQHRAMWLSIRQVNKRSQDGFVCVFLPQNALLDFMEQTVDSAACVRMEPPVTRPTENAHVPVDGRAQPANWVRLREAVSKSLHMLPQNPPSLPSFWWKFQFVII